MEITRVRGLLVGGAAAALACSPLVTGPAAAAGPDIVWDYSMPDNFGPSVTGVVGPPGAQQDLTGMYVPQVPMKADPDYPQAGNALYGTVPADGKYQVDLTACATAVTGNAVYEWTIDGVFHATSNCAYSPMLTEGVRNYTLTITDSTGSTTVGGSFTVKNTLIALYGDSYSSGEGYPPFYKDNPNATPEKPYIVDWDEASCNRSRWSGFVRAANQLEKLDPRSNVTLMNVSCAGGIITNDELLGMAGENGGGILRSQSKMSATGSVPDVDDRVPPQVDQINGLRKNQKVDMGFLSIGGNDIGFGNILGSCFLEAGYEDSCFSDDSPLYGEPLYEATDKLLAALPAKYAAAAQCLNDGNNCNTIKGNALTPTSPSTPSEPNGIPAGNLIQAAYPNLTHKSDGSFCNRSFDPDDPTSAEGTISLLSPLKHGDSEWATRVAINGVPGTTYTIPVWLGSAQDPYVPVPTDPLQTVQVTPTAPGLAVQFGNNATILGWTVTADPYVNTASGGLCADESTRALYPVMQDFLPIGTPPIVGGIYNQAGTAHPNNRGQDVYRQALFSKAQERSGLPVSAPTQTDQTPMVYAPDVASVKVTTSKAMSKKSSLAKKATKKKVTIRFAAPTQGLIPDGYKIRVKTKNGNWRTLRDYLKTTSTVWKKAPKPGSTFRIKVASYVWGRNTNNDASTVMVAWTPAKTLKIKRG